MLRLACAALLIAAPALAVERLGRPPDGLVLEASLGAGGSQIATAPGLSEHGGMIFEAGLSTLLRFSNYEAGLGFSGTGLSPLSSVGGSVMGVHATAGFTICDHGPALGLRLEGGLHVYNDVRWKPAFSDTEHPHRSIGSALLPYAGVLLDVGRGGSTHGALGFFVRVDLGHAQAEGGQIGGLMAGLSMRFGGTAILFR